MKKLVLSYELSWRTKSDKLFLRSVEWLKEIRPWILQRDNYTCQYCGYRNESGMQVNHVDGNPKNNDDKNLEVICNYCHMITHSGLWCVVFKSVDVYEKSNYDQNNVNRITRKMREEGKTDDEIAEFLGLRDKVPWMQDLKYLKNKYGFITSRKADKQGYGVTLTEKDQKFMVERREGW